MKKLRIFIISVMCILMLSSCDLKKVYKNGNIPVIEPETGVYAVSEDDVTAFADGRDVTEKTNINTLTKKSEFLKKAEEIEDYSKNNYENALTQDVLNTESYNVYMKWEALLSEVYQHLSLSMSSDDFSAIETDEKQWRSEMEEAMDKEAEKWKNGSGEPMARNSVGIQYTSERCYYLIFLM